MIVAREQLKAFIARIERMEEEKKSITQDISYIYSEAKAMGYDAKIMRKIVSMRKKDEQQRQEEEAVMDTYLVALGMQPDLFQEEAA